MSSFLLTIINCSAVSLNILANNLSSLSFNSVRRIKTLEPEFILPSPLTAEEAAFFNSMADPAIICDSKGTILDINSALIEDLGFNESDIVGLDLSNIIGESGVIQFAATVKELLQGNINRATIECTVTTTDARPITLSVSLSVVRGADGNYKGILVNGRNITDLMDKATKGPLTGAYNRSFFNDAIANEISRSTHNGPVSMLMIDIDHFKTVNDSYGHPEGDMVLKNVAETIAAQLWRDADYLVRYGEEDFAVILPNTDSAGAQTIAERIRNAIENARIEGSKAIHSITVSAGVATYTHTDNSRVDIEKETRDIVEHADLALYESKESGRNRVSVYQEEDLF